MKKEKNVTNRQWNKINTVYYYIIKEFKVRTSTEIPVFMQKLNVNFLCQTRGIIVQISQSELWDLCPSALIITGNKCVKFQSIPFSSNRDTSLHAKT